MDGKMKVEELSNYGTAFDYMPLTAQTLQMKIMFSEVKKSLDYLVLLDLS